MVREMKQYLVKNNGGTYYLMTEFSNWELYCMGKKYDSIDDVKKDFEIIGPCDELQKIEAAIEFKDGDKVRIIKIIEPLGGLGWPYKTIGKTGRVSCEKDGNIGVLFEDNRTEWFYHRDSLELIEES